MRDTMTIYCFSATGNSLKTAQDIAAENPGCKIIPMQKFSEQPIYSDSKKVGFIFPVYMGVLPEIVNRFLANFRADPDTYYFSIATYYKYKGIALSVLNDRLRAKGAKLHYGSVVPMVGNCLQEYEVSVGKRIDLLLRADKKISLIAQDIKVGMKNIDNLGYCQLNENLHKATFRFFFKNTNNKFSLKSTCSGCKMCIKICPVNNISIIDKKPTWGLNCESCHACVHWCPQNAVNIKKSEGRLQYHHPNIRYNELLKFQNKFV